MRAADPGLVRDLGRLVSPERVLSRVIDRLARSSDASIYRLVPEAVVRPRDLGELRALLGYALARGRHLTFRAAGTSLSGQAVSDDLLVELGPHWRGFRVLDGGRRVWAQPGVIGGQLNRALASSGHRIGPDPASLDAAMFGGILANNASGMCCGVVQNAYHTLDAITLLLADGTLVDSGRPDADERLRREAPLIHGGLQRLRDEIRADAALATKIRRKFARKNTTGYSLNAFLDYERPTEILAHLMIGSEGTLGFIVDATLRTVPYPPSRATALLLFADLVEAGAAVLPLAEAGAAALEILDSACLRVLSGRLGAAADLDRRSAALLVELQSPDDVTLGDTQAGAEAVARRFRLQTPARFSRDALEREALWKLRKGLASATGAMRPSGTAFLTEDVAVPVERLAEAILDCQELFAQYQVPDTILFGHAKDGNLHFVLSEDLRRPEAVARYGRFMQGLVELVAGKYDGALKAEHGSGRNMAPFVRMEWGDAAYEAMRRVKRLLDPCGILNPGVVLNDDPMAHLTNLKEMPEISATADRCIECGFCEPRCPSRELTLTPRQRIRVTREIARLSQLQGAEARATRETLERQFGYDGVATCAADGMCQASCPVEIDTGALMKERRAAEHSWGAGRLAGVVADQFAAASSLVRTSLRAPNLLRAFGFVAGTQLPPPAPPLPQPKQAPGRPRVVYFPSCLTRTLGAAEGARPLAAAMLDVLEAAGYEIAYPAQVEGLCCGMPFASKAFEAAAERAAERTREALWAASHDGRDPVVIDASPCALTLCEAAAEAFATSGRVLRVLDFPVFWAREALKRLPALRKLAGPIVLHPTCSLQRGGGADDLRRAAEAHAEAVIVPLFAECCGFAGDRGFVVPELTASATRAEAEELNAIAASGYYSTCRTCELGLSRATGQTYRSLVHLIHESLGLG